MQSEGDGLVSSHRLKTDLPDTAARRRSHAYGASVSRVTAAPDGRFDHAVGHPLLGRVPVSAPVGRVVAAGLWDSRPSGGGVGELHELRLLARVPSAPRTRAHATFANGRGEDEIRIVGGARVLRGATGEGMLVVMLGRGGRSAVG